MVTPLCPVCGAPLTTDVSVWQCGNNHSFDVARQGYVNLLTVRQKHSLHPGDTREMVAARQAFLNTGAYLPIAETLRESVSTYAPQASSVLDVGCGEGYYLSQLPQVAARWGIDISKEAVRFAAVREKGAKFLTASAAHLPFADGSFDCLLSMFALTVAAEYARVLSKNGIFVRVLAGERHLLGLKRIIYPEIIEKEAPFDPYLDGFTLLKSETIRFTFSLNDAQTVRDLLYMTPHVWRISKQGAERLANTTALTDTAEVVFHIYRVDK